MILKFSSHQKWLIFVVNLQIYFALNSLVLVSCDGLLSFRDEIASTHSYRKNFTRSLYNRFEHLEFLKDDDSPLSVRRLIRPTTAASPSASSTSRHVTYEAYDDGPPPANSAYNGNPYPSNINHDPLWNSNNRFTNRFDRFFNKIPSFLYTTYSTHAYEPSFTTARPFYKPSAGYDNHGPINSISSKPGSAAVSSNIRPVNVRPNYTSNAHSKPSPSYGSNKYSKYSADCACKRKSGGYTYLSTTAAPQASTSTSSGAPASTTKRSIFRHGRSVPSLTRESHANEKDINTRIVNGTVADYYRFPWTVSLGRAIDNKYTNASHYCGGGCLLCPVESLRRLLIAV